MIRIFEQELLPNIKRYDVVLFGMGINNAFNKGLLYEIALNFPDVKKKENNDSPYGDKRKYGKIFDVTIDNIIFCACYMDDGGYKSKCGVKYDCLETCLESVKKKYAGKKICSPLIGVGDFGGNGDKKKILGIFEKVFKEQDIDLYDYEQKDFKFEIFKEFNINHKAYKEGEITKEAYIEKKRRLYWKKYNGTLKEMPDDYNYKSRNNLIRVKKSDLE